MALGDLQKSLAEIFSSKQERNRFFANKSNWADSQKYLSLEDKKHLVSLKQERVKHYTDSLRWKRLRVIMDMLPLFSRNIDHRRLIKLFDNYADNNPLLNGSRHKFRSHFVRDVVCFCSYLQENKREYLKGKEWLADLAYYESQKLNEEVSLIPLDALVKKLSSRKQSQSMGSSKRKGKNTKNAKLSAE